jgi:YegS/Rv2252/BmrU family lipid kinase
LEDKRKWFAIVNPKAGFGKVKKEWPIIQKHLLDESVDFDFSITKRKYHAVELTVSAISKGYKKILCVGGDGTLNEIVNGIFIQSKYPQSDILIGAIGVGKSNIFEKMYPIPKSYQGVAIALKEEKSFMQDVGMVQFFESRIRHTRYFANSGGIGFEAELIFNSNTLKESGRKGMIHFHFSIIKSLILYRTSMVKVQIDDINLSGKFFSIFVRVENCHEEGIPNFPNANPNEEMFDITIINNISRWQVLRNLHRLSSGSIHNHPKISRYKGKKVTISSKPHVNLEVDGESLGGSPFTFSILPKSIKVLVVPNFKGVNQ